MKRILTISTLSLSLSTFGCSDDGTPAGTGGSGGTDPGTGGATTGGTGQGTGGGNPGSGGTNPGSGGTNPGSGGEGNPGSGGTNPGSGGNNPGSGGNNPGSGGESNPPDPPPPVIVTSPNNEWDTSIQPTMGTGAATITVDPTDMRQAWHGFGGTFNEAGWAALQALNDQAAVDLAIKLLFDANEGANFTWGRIPMGPSDYAVARYTLSSGPGEFDIGHDEQYLIPYIQAAQAVKDDIRFWASPWSPPPWAKTGTTENMGYDKGIFDTQHFQAYADYFVDWIEAYQAKGIPIDHVQPQNEPGWSQAYPTAAFGPAWESSPSLVEVYADEPYSLGPFVDQYLFPAIDAAGLSTKVWFGTLSNNRTSGGYIDSMLTQPSASRIVGFGLQWGTDGEIPALLNADYLVMQSEHKCGHYPWNEDGNPDYWLFTGSPQSGPAPNDYNYGRESWDHLTNWIEKGVHIYSAWNMILDANGKNLDEARAWYQNALLVADNGMLTPTPTYYVFRHIAQYVRPGATRLGTTGGSALAFKNVDESIIVALHNKSNQDVTMSVSDGTTTYEFPMPALGFATVSFNTGG